MDYRNFLSPRGELLPYKGDFYLWKYVPSMAAAVIFTIIFLALSALHTWKMFRTRLWFCIPFVIGGYMEVIGFIGRIAANNATDQLMPYIIQSVFLLIPPSLFAASIYMTLGRIISGLGSKAELCSIIRVKWLTKLFVIGDVFSFLIQSTGAGLMAAGNDPKMGENIVVGGLFIQILFFGLFVAAALIFHLRYRKRSAHRRTMDSTGIVGTFDWEGMMMMLYATSALILVRCIFRIIEYVMGADAYPLKNEWTLYVFDAVLMVATMGIFYIWYPSQIQEFQAMRDTEVVSLAYGPVAS
ncbi:RTA1 domain-containing protein [Colletotrichum truncatum]|uniref:RTA1 domain-containing protein n=1 Tax=Colletotrichum truncatum TaxID=5467 RepID=A0ACC3ZBS1_COLTU|nr:RTA1 domain-containing protein [Colletotrichum truncatum]KAF6787780.1 RTA1 domain-containing protein [Colletotrichum truncatum]